MLSPAEIARTFPDWSTEATPGFELVQNRNLFVAFSGTKWFLKEVKRKSAKAEAEALAIAEASLRGCVNHVAEKNGLELAEEIA